MGAKSRRLNLDELSFANSLGEKRREVLARYGVEILDEPVSTAIDIYTGVLYQALGYHSLSPSEKRRANSQLLISSALFGVLRPLDQIPQYKFKMKSAEWSLALPAALDNLESELIVDSRSSTYAATWKPDPAITVAVCVFQVKGEERSVITHMSKKYRGELVRALLGVKPLKNPQELALLASKTFDVEMSGPFENHPYQLNILIPAPERSL